MGFAQVLPLGRSLDLPGADGHRQPLPPASFDCGEQIVVTKVTFLLPKKKEKA